MRKITNLLILLMVILLSLAFLTSTAQRNLSTSNQAPQDAKFSEFSGNNYKSQITYRNTVFSEDFESGTFPPIGWTKMDFHADPLSNWHEATLDLNTFSEVQYVNANLMDEWMITPSLDLSTYTNLQLRFSFFMSYYWMVDPFDGGDLMVKVSTDGGTNWTQIWVEEDFGLFTNFTWYDVTLPFSTYAGLSDVKIAFHWYGDDGAQTRFDDVILEEPPACPPPTGLYSENITSTTALLGWTPGGSETLWNIAVGLPDFDPDVPSEWVAGENGTNKNPWPVEGLISGTSYEFYVQADCGAKEVSEWVGPVSFTTYCIFECPVGSIAETEACGDTINNGCNLVITQTFESINPGDVICGTVWAEGGFKDNDWFELVLAEPSQVILHAYAETELLFGLVEGLDPANPDCVDITGFINPVESTDICSPVSLDLGVLIAGTHWFFAGLPVFDGFPCDLNYWIEFEVIEVDCLPPTALNATTLSTTSVELTWTAGGDELEWEVAVVPTGDPEPTSGTLVDVTNYTATGLTFGQSYDAYVRSICVTKSESLWVKTTFTINYCAAGPSSAVDSDLFRVQLTGPDVNFDHNVGCTGILGAQDFTGLGAIGLQQGVEYTMTLTMGQCGTGTYTNVGKAWADWDQDVVLVEPDERLGVVQGVTSSTGIAYTFNFTVPLGAELGVTGLRVMQRETSDPLLVTPCASFSWGSVHDYLVEVLPPPATPVFSVLPTEWDFGDIEVGEQSGLKVFTISNAGPGVLTVQAPTLDNDVDYTLDYEPLDYPAELEGAETVTFSVVFHPSVAGERYGEVSISYDDTEAIATVELYGVGIVRPAGSTCGNPYPVTLPVVDFAGDTEPMGDDYENTWIEPNSGYITGNDMVFQFTLSEPGYLSGSLTSLQTWIGLFILEDCPDPVNPAEVLVSATTTGDSTSFTDHLIDAGTYFAIVSSFPAPQTIEFTLNLSFEPLPACPAPTALTATGITATSALLGWTEIGSATSWNIEWGLDGFEQGVDGTLVPGVANPHLLEGLDPETDYEFYVQADCGEASRELSEWAGPFAFSTPVSCPAPTALTTVSTTTDGAEVSWTSAAPEFEIEYGEAPYTFTGNANVISIMTNSYTFIGLDPATTYQYKVKAICGEEDESLWSAVGSFTTDCLPIDLPWCETFDEVTVPAIPVCMTVTDDNDDANRWVTVILNPNSPPNAIYLNYNFSLASDDWFFSPGLNLEGGVTYAVEFEYRARSTSYFESLEVAWGNNPNATGMTGGTIWDNPSFNNASYQSVYETFTPTITGIYYIGWHGYSIANQWGIYVDDICITEEEPEVPENRLVDGITLGVDDVECYDATITITVTNTVIGNGASAEFRAGENIIFGDGFVVESGAYMHAMITDVYCLLPDAIVSAEEVILPEEIPAIPVQESFFKVFPNPTTSTFKLELLGADEAAKINVEIYGMMGERVFQDVLFGGSQYEFDLSNMPKGIYFIRVLMGDEMGIEKVIKQ
jgi:hypothetical protein